MFAAMLFTIASAALLQFALYYWRALLAGVASQPVSERVLEAAHLETGEFSGADFTRLVGLLEMTPELKNGKNGLGLAGAYYSMVHAMNAAFGRLSPALASWSERESALCARFAAVQIDRRLQANLAQAASIHSY
jgi:hypothetical protein